MAVLSCSTSSIMSSRAWASLERVGSSAQLCMLSVSCSPLALVSPVSSHPAALRCASSHLSATDDQAANKMPDKALEERHSARHNHISTRRKWSQRSSCAGVPAKQCSAMQASCSAPTGRRLCTLPCGAPACRAAIKISGRQQFAALQSSAHPYSSFSACAKKGRPGLPSGSASM